MQLQLVNDLFSIVVFEFNCIICQNFKVTEGPKTLAIENSVFILVSIKGLSIKSIFILLLIKNSIYSLI